MRHGTPMKGIWEARWMYSKLDDILALVGLLLFLSGIYLWLGLPATLILFGIILVFIAWRLPLPSKVEGNEPDKTTNKAA